MRKGKKIYKKFLSCVLATAMVVTSGVIYPGNEKVAVAAEETETEGLFTVTSSDGTKTPWYIIKSDQDEKRVIKDSQGVLYQLKESNIATVIGYDTAGNAKIIIPDMVPINVTNYDTYISDGKIDGTAMESSKVTAIEAEAFSGSLDLVSVTVSGNVTSIGYRAFASCPDLGMLSWNIADKDESGDEVEVEIGTAILQGSPKCILYSDYGNSQVVKYIKENGYDSAPRPDDSPTAEPTPTVLPTEAPGTEPTPTVLPTEAPDTEPTPTVVPTVIPTPVVSTSTPTVTAYPTASVTPSVAPVTPTPTVATTSPVLTEEPKETIAPATTAPTEEPVASAPASQKPAITEAPENTPAPVQSTKAPASGEIIVTNDVTYEVNQNQKSVSVSRMKEVKTSTVKIPATVEVNGVKYPVTSIDVRAFKDNITIKEVQLGENVKTIERGAFRGCKNLTSVKFPSKLQVIRKNSFNGCSKLKSVEIPNTVTRVGNAAFKDCASMKTFSIGGNPKKKTGGLSIDENQIRYGASTVTVNIGKKAFENCKKLNKVIINALVKIIGKSAFKDCKSLRSVLVYSKVLKKVKGGALKGVNNCKISVPSKKVEPYKILFKNKGQGKKVVVAKL